MIRCSLMAGVLCCGWIAAVPAEEIAPKDARSVVEQSVTKYAEAFAQQNAKALAELFTPEAELVTAGGTIFHGRAVIEAEFAANFAANPKGKAAIELLSIRPIASGVLVEDGVSNFQSDGSGVRTTTRYTATHVKQADGSWLIASVREIDAKPLTPHDRLVALAWLIGEWHEDVAGSTIATSWKWDASGNFLVSEFEHRSGDNASVTGTHRIGWDAERKQLRSWVFDSTGGSAGGSWQVNADGTWSVHLTRIDTEGDRTLSLLTYAAEGKDTIVVSVDQIVRHGVSQMGSVHRIVRQPPAPAAASR